MSPTGTPLSVPASGINARSKLRSIPHKDPIKPSIPNTTTTTVRVMAMSIPFLLNFFLIMKSKTAPRIRNENAVLGAMGI